MTKATPTPTIELRVLFLSPGRREILKVKPDKPGSFLIGDGRHDYDQGNIVPGFQKKNGFDLVAVQGRPKCLSIWEAQEILTPEEYDAAVSNNFVAQVFEMSSGKKGSKIDWVTFGVGAVLILAVVGVGFMLNGDMKDLEKDIAAIGQDPEQLRFNQDPRDGVTVTPGPEPAFNGPSGDGS